MKLCRICLAGMVLLLLLVSCSEAQVAKDDTQTFLLSLYWTVTQAMGRESSELLQDFRGSEPPGSEVLSSIKSFETVSIGKLRAPDPLWIDTLYGTWRYDVGTGWYPYTAGDPANALLFEWPYLDDTSGTHLGEFLIDSLEFYQDSLPTDVWMGIYSDQALLAWLKLEAEYLSLGEMNEVSLIYEIVNYFQIGMSMSSPTAIDSTIFDTFTGTVSLWAIDRINYDYTVELDVTFEEGFPVEIVLSDPDGWEMDVTFSDVVGTDGDYERRDVVSGEVTQNGHHAADISGYIWYRIVGGKLEVSDDSDVVITFSDNTTGDFLYYMPF